MSTLPYSEFEWNSATATNGKSGIGLAETIIKRVTALENVKAFGISAAGNGYITGRLALLGYNVVGVDSSE